jgi:brefeldin A-inhibited guanine nucleotide-exchange protein
MIQALRDLIDLYTFYFDVLERFLDGLLDLLCVCICQGTVIEDLLYMNY